MITYSVEAEVSARSNGQYDLEETSPQLCDPIQFAIRHRALVLSAKFDLRLNARKKYYELLKT